MLKNRHDVAFFHDIAFFVELFKFELYENFKRTDIINLFFTLSVYLFVFDLCNVMYFSTRFSVG